MADYYNRQSARACEGDPVRIIRTFRLHPDRIDDPGCATSPAVEGGEG